MVDSTRLLGKVALVTGGSSGIGRATAERLLAEGAKVLVADLRGGSTHPDGSIGIDCDVSNEAQVASAIAEVESRFGQLDVVVNSAGITGGVGRVHEYDPTEWDRVMSINVRGPFLVMRAAIPLLLASGGGSIVNLASVGSFIYAGGSSAYTPSKGALLMLSRQAAIDYAKDGIRVNAVCPGITDTPILDGAPIGLDILAGFVPVGRLGKPEEIAALIAYLASDESAFVTGSAMLIDGGMTSV